MRDIIMQKCVETCAHVWVWFLCPLCFGNWQNIFSLVRFILNWQLHVFSLTRGIFLSDFENIRHLEALAILFTPISKGNLDCKRAPSFARSPKIGVFERGLMRGREMGEWGEGVATPSLPHSPISILAQKPWFLDFWQRKGLFCSLRVTIYSYKKGCHSQ